MRRFVMAAAAAFLATGALIGFASSSVARPADVVTEDNDNDRVRNVPDPAGDSDNRHPSKRDRHAEGGRSGNQGKARAQPDQDARGPERDVGGADQPGRPGGGDTLDQDGNNGCGNDDDFEDDSEGRCERARRVAVPTRSPSPMPAASPHATLSRRATEPVEVLGGDFRGPEIVAAGGVTELPTTGSASQTLLLLSIVLIDAGMLLLVVRPRQPSTSSSETTVISSRLSSAAVTPSPSRRTPENVPS